MATIFLKGNKQYEVSRDLGIKLQKAFKDNSIGMEEIIEAGEIMIAKSEIKGVSLFSPEAVNMEKRISDENKQRIDAEYEYEVYRKEMLSLTPEDRANNLGIFNLIYWAIRKEQPSEEDREKAKQIQIAFFKEHTKRIYIDPILFRRIFGNEDANDGWASSAIGIVESAVALDMSYEK